jgi:hypothetical protein
LGNGSLDNNTSFNEINLQTSANFSNLGPPNSSLTTTPPGSYSLFTPTPYSDAQMTVSGSIQSNMTTQHNSPQIVQSGTTTLQNLAVAPGWFAKNFNVFNVVQNFTLTSSYYYQLHEQGTAITNSEFSYVAGQLNGPSGNVANWFLSGVLDTPTSTDVTVSGLLGPGSYSLQFGSEVAAYSDFNPNYVASSSGFGTQTLTLTPVPEPASLAAFGVGALCLIGYGWRRRNKPGLAG